VRRVPQEGPADSEQPGGVDGDADKQEGEGDGEVLDGRGGRGNPAVASGLPQRRRRDDAILAAPASQGDWAALLPFALMTCYSGFVSCAPTAPQVSLGDVNPGNPGEPCRRALLALARPLH